MSRHRLTWTVVGAMMVVLLPLLSSALAASACPLTEPLALDGTSTPTVAPALPPTSTLEPTPTSAVTPTLQLAVEKLVFPQEAVVGETITYTLVVTNTSLLSAQGLVMTDSLPLQVSYLYGDGSEVYDPESHLLRWEVASLEAGEVVTHEVYVQAEEATGALLNTVEVTAPGLDSPVTATASSSIVKPSLHLVVEKSVFPREAVVGETITYTLAITNTSSLSVRDLLVSDQVPEEVSYLYGDGSEVYDPDSRLLRWEVASLEAGEGVTHEFYVQAEEVTDTLLNTVEVTGPDLEGPVTASAISSVVMPTLQLEVGKAVFPLQAVVGDVITYTLTVTNTGLLPAENLSIIDRLPSEAGYLYGEGSEIYDTESGVVSWGVASLGATEVVTHEVYVQAEEATDALLNTVEVTGPGLESPVTAVVTSTVAPAPAEDEVVIMPERGGALRSRNGKVAVFFPPGLASKGLRVKHTLRSAQPWDLIFYAFDLSAWEETEGRAPVTQFRKPVKIVVHYTAEDLGMIKEEGLHLAYWDDKGEKWVKIPSKVDTKNNTITAFLKHFSEVAVQGAADHVVVVPDTIWGFQNDLFSGSASFQYPLEVPPGSAGFAPRLTLTYNSSLVNEMKDSTATGDWVGPGFSLGMAEIRRKDTQYTLVLNGTSYKLVQDSNNRWRTNPESFLYIEFVPQPGYWKIRDRDGTFYQLGYKAWDGTPGGDGSRLLYLDANKNAVYHRWVVDKIQDTHGNIIEVENQTWGYQGTDAGGSQVWVPEDVYPHWIRYSTNTSQEDSFGEYQIEFRVADKGGTPSAGEKKHLTDIIVYQVDPSEGLKQMRHHQYQYLAQGSADLPSGYPGNLYLGSIIEYGITDSRSLPPLSFKYVGLNIEYWESGQLKAQRARGFLDVVRNGYGGEVDFDYTGWSASATAYWTRQLVAKKTTRTVSGSQPDVYSTYSYASGVVDGLSFVGFSEAQETDAAGNRIKHLFHAYATSNSSWPLNGKGKQTEWRDSAGNLYQQTTYEWCMLAGTVTTNVFVGAEETLTYDGDSDYRRNRITYGYDNYGNTTMEMHHGSRLYVPNAGFEEGSDGLGSWTKEGTAAIQTTPDYRLMARNAVKMTGSTTGKLYQAMDYGAVGQRYLVGIMARKGSNSDTAGFQLVVSNKNNGNAVSVTPALTDRWQLVTLIYTPDVANMRIELRYLGGTGTIYADEVFAEKMEDVAEDYTVRREFYPNSDPNTWIVNRPALEVVYKGIAGEGNPELRVQETQYYYDGHTGLAAPPVRGDLTKTGQGLSGAEPFYYTQYGYDGYGNRTVVTDPLYHATTTTYHPTYMGCPIAVTNALGHQTAYLYDFQRGRISSTTDPNGATTSYQYDEFGRLTGMWNPSEQGSPDATIRYTYTESATSPNIVRKDVRGDEGGSTQAEYHMAWSFYDGLGRLIQTQALNQHLIGIPEGPLHIENVVVDRHYNNRSLPDKESVPRFANFPLGAYQAPVWDSLSKTLYSYDPMGRVTKVTNPDSTFRTTSYDDWVTTATDESGHQKRYTNDANRRLIQAEELDSGWTYGRSQYSYDALGNLTEMKVPSEIVIRARGISGGGGWPVMRLRVNGTAIYEWTVANSSWDFYYVQAVLTGNDKVDVVFTNNYCCDGGNRDLYVDYIMVAGQTIQAESSQVKWDRGSGDAAFDGQDVVPGQELVFYNGALRFELVSSNLATVTTIAYDSHGWKRAMNDPDMGAWSYEYDAAGNLIRQTDALGRKIRLGYDVLNRLVSKDYGDNGIPEIAFAYDQGNYGVGRLYRMSDEASTTTYAHDANGRVTSEGREIPIGAYTTTYSYYADDLLHTMTYPDGEVVTSTYDFHRLLQTMMGDDTYFAGAQYDALGRITDLPLGNGLTTNYAYDPLNFRLTQMKTGNLLDLRYSYDPEGNILDLFDGIRNETQRFTYDSLDRAKSLATKSGNQKEIVVRARGTSGGGGWPVMQLRVNGTIVGQWTVASSEWGLYTVQALLTGYDQVDVVFTNNYCCVGGNRDLYVDYIVVAGQTIQAESSQVTWDRGSGAAAFDGQDVVPGQELVYYNGALRVLVDSKSGWTTLEQYSYNTLGNPLSKGTVSYAYNDPSHIHAVTDLNGVQKYWYDANGNMTQRIVGGTTQSLSYDYDNRLIGVQDGTNTVTFAYDGAGQRVMKTENGVTTVCIGNYFEVNQSTGEVTKYYYANLGGSARLVAFRKGDALYYTHPDHLRSTSLVTDDTGQEVGRMGYYPYGSTRYSSGTLPTEKRFTGQRLEAELGLYDFNARYYDPAIGRFISPDTIIPNIKNPQVLNRYSYGLNNPLRYTDESGHFPIDWLLDLGGLALDVYTLVTQPSLENVGWLAADVVLWAVPYVPSCAGIVGRGAGVAAHADEALELARVISNTPEAVKAIRTAERLTEAGNTARNIGQVPVTEYRNWTKMSAKLGQQGFKVVEDAERLAKSGNRALYEFGTRTIVYGPETRLSDFLHEAVHTAQHRQIGFTPQVGGITLTRMELGAYEWELRNQKWIGHSPGGLKWIKDTIRDTRLKMFLLR